MRVEEEFPAKGIGAVADVDVELDVAVWDRRVREGEGLCGARGEDLDGVEEEDGG